MKRSELIEKLMCAAPDDEDPEIYIDAIPDGLLEVEEVGVSDDTDGIVIWVE